MAICVFRAKTVGGDVLTVEVITITHNGNFISNAYYVINGDDCTELERLSNDTFVEVMSGKLITFITDKEGNIVHE